MVIKPFKSVEDFKKKLTPRELRNLEISNIDEIEKDFPKDCEYSTYRHGGKTIAFTVVNPRNRKLELIVVNKTVRGRGYAKEIVLGLRDKGIVNKLSVINTNLQAIVTYTKCEFVIVDMEGDWLHMEYKRGK